MPRHFGPPLPFRRPADYFHCECDAEATDFTLHCYTPKYCEHIGRKFCQVRKGDSSIGSSSSHCGNGGLCLTKHNLDADLNSPVHRLGCECPKEFYGENCEHMYEEYMAGISPYGISQDHNRSETKGQEGCRLGCWNHQFRYHLRCVPKTRRNNRRDNRHKYPPVETDDRAMALKSGVQYA